MGDVGYSYPGFGRPNNSGVFFGYGMTVVIRSMAPNGLTFYALYGHLGLNGLPTLDDKVTAGQVIGKVGSTAEVKQFLGTGKFTGPRLHLEITHGQAPITLREIAVSVGSVALAPHERPGWLTYNFEVERLHTYIAGGVRVHNDSASVPNDPRALNSLNSLDPNAPAGLAGLGAPAAADATAAPAAGTAAVNADATAAGTAAAAATAASEAAGDDSSSSDGSSASSIRSQPSLCTTHDRRLGSP